LSTAAIQVAKLAGCTVFVTSSTDEKLQKAKALGADVLVNYKAVPWSKAVWELTGRRGVDVIVDHVGPATFKDSVRTLRKGGRVVVPGATTGSMIDRDGSSILQSKLSSGVVWILGASSSISNGSDRAEIQGVFTKHRSKNMILGEIPTPTINGGKMTGHPGYSSRILDGSSVLPPR